MTVTTYESAYGSILAFRTSAGVVEPEEITLWHAAKHLSDDRDLVLENFSLHCDP